MLLRERDIVRLQQPKLVGDTGRVIGIDISSGMVTQARNKAKKLNLNNLEFQLADGEALDFPPNSFDIRIIYLSYQSSI